MPARRTPARPRPARRLFSMAAAGLLIFAGGAGAASLEEAKASVDRPTVNLGDEFTYVIDVVTIGARQSSPHITEPPLENWFQVESAETRSGLDQRGGQAIIHTVKVFHLLANHTGTITIPPARVALLDSAGRTLATRETNPVPLLVHAASGQAAAPTPTPEIDILKPIKSSARLNPSQWLPYALGAAAIGLWLGMLAWWPRRPRAPRPPVPADPRTPTQRALDALAQAAGLRQPGREVELYFSLSRILRAYLGEEYLFPAEEMTTAELLAELAARRFTPEYLGRMRAHLTPMDPVKYAHAAPSAGEAERAWRETRALIEAPGKTIPEPALAVSQSGLS